MRLGPVSLPASRRRPSPNGQCPLCQKRTHALQQKAFDPPPGRRVRLSADAAGYGYGSYSGYGYSAYSSYYVPYGTSYAAPYGVYSSSYAIAHKRLQSGYAAPYGPIFY
jgi:hypothetical protein